jgi:hypothetical protein
VCNVLGLLEITGSSVFSRGRIKCSGQQHKIIMMAVTDWEGGGGIGARLNSPRATKNSALTI